MKRDKFSFKNINFIIFNNTSHIENIYKKCKVDKNPFHFLAIILFVLEGKILKLFQLNTIIVKLMEKDFIHYLSLHF